MVWVANHANSLLRLGFRSRSSPRCIATLYGARQQVTNGTLRRLAFSGNRASRLAGALLVSGWYLDMQVGEGRA